MGDLNLWSLVHVSHRETFKVRVFESLDWCDAFLRVEDHHFVHEIDGVLTRIRYQLVERCGHELREREVDLGCKLVTFGPLGLGWTTEHGTSLVNLVSLVVAWEKWTHQV